MLFHNTSIFTDSLASLSQVNRIVVRYLKTNLQYSTDVQYKMIFDRAGLNHIVKVMFYNSFKTMSIACNFSTLFSNENTSMKHRLCTGTFLVFQ